MWCTAMEFTNGQITRNAAENSGGGIYIGHSLQMSQGFVSGNTASHVGGGVFINSGGGRAEFNTLGNDQRIYITNNLAKATGGHGLSGGGIFVEHPQDTYKNDDNGQSRAVLMNALISENKATLSGGGIAGCGTSHIYDYAIDGAAIFDNKLGQNPDKPEGVDLYFDNQYGEMDDTRVATVSRQMLLPQDLVTWEGIYGTGNGTSTLSDWGDSITRVFNGRFYLTASVENDAVKDRERAAAKVIITGNVSKDKGGGIGGNGHIQLGVNRALIVEKQVQNALQEEQNKRFSFKIHLYGKDDSENEITLNQEYWYTIKRSNGGVDTGISINGKIEFELGHGDQIQVYKLPGTGDIYYTVEEKKADHFETTVTLDNKEQELEQTNLEKTVITGVIESGIDGVIHDVRFTNKRLNEITVVKKWEGDEKASGARPTSVKVQLMSLPRNADSTEPTPVGNSVTLNGPDWKYTWKNLDSDYLYSVKEIDIPAGYTSMLTGGGSEFIENGELTLTNVYNMTSLRVKKIWQGDDDRQENRPASIRVMLLKDSEKIEEQTLSDQNEWSYTWNNLQKEHTWEVTEVDVLDNYICSTEAPQLEEDGVYCIHITNTYHEPPESGTGSLTIQKTVEGASTAQKFTFTVELKDKDGNPLTESYPYTGAISGSIKSGESILLGHNESITITGLPAGTEFKVSEARLGNYTAEVTTDGTANGGTGTIGKDQTHTVKFVNKEVGPTPETGSLTIQKTVEGASTDQKFTFTVDLRNAAGAPLTGSYPYHGSQSGVIRDGGTVRLGHGDSVTVTGLPVGTRFSVRESDMAGYTATITTDGTANTRGGAIEADQTHTVQFVNRPIEDRPPREPHKPNDPKDPTPPENPGDPENPGNPENPPETPENPETPETPEIPENPETPENPESPDTPAPPETPEQPLTELPDPNAPGSPERVTIIGEDGVPLTYIKVWDPEKEEFVYLPEDEVPLFGLDDTPQTGDSAKPVLWGGIFAAAVAACYLLLPRNRKKRRIRRRRARRRR